MAIYYKLVPRKKPGTTTVKWYGSAVNTGVVKIDQLAEEMSSESTVTRHDVLSVLSSLQQHIMRHLALGHSVRLGDLGSFHASLYGYGSEQKKDYSPSMLKGIRVHFRRSPYLKREISLAKVPIQNVSAINLQPITE
ncbi:MAG: DNA-binding protein [Bacteroidaceae bacterium]|nr:DNA-binding protein [Bacteroidaceae bacterium]MBR7028703.1 DNA-binding protein [Bacteroidaceae bacterium]